jgi:hypothetical protein
MTASFTPTATIRKTSGDSGDSGDNVDFLGFFPNAGGDNSGDSGDNAAARVSHGSISCRRWPAVTTGITQRQVTREQPHVAVAITSRHLL